MTGVILNFTLQILTRILAQKMQIPKVGISLVTIFLRTVISLYATSSFFKVFVDDMFRATGKPK